MYLVWARAIQLVRPRPRGEEAGTTRARARARARRSSLGRSEECCRYDSDSPAVRSKGFIYGQQCAGRSFSRAGRVQHINRSVGVNDACERRIRGDTPFIPSPPEPRCVVCRAQRLTRKRRYGNVPSARLRARQYQLITASRRGQGSDVSSSCPVAQSSRLHAYTQVPRADPGDNLALQLLAR